jgi:hypothetical protein
MDTRSTIDPRILRGQQEAAEAKDRQRVFVQKAMEYRSQLQQRVNQDRGLYMLNGHDRVGLQLAVKDAAEYFARRDLDGPALAKAWLNVRLQELQQQMTKDKEVNALATIHDTAVIGAAAIAHAATGNEVAGTGQAAKMNKVASGEAVGTKRHYDMLVAFTQ